MRVLRLQGELFSQLRTLSMECSLPCANSCKAVYAFLRPQWPWQISSKHLLLQSENESLEKLWATSQQVADSEFKPCLPFLHTKFHAKHYDYLTFFLRAEAAEHPLMQAEALGYWSGVLSEFPVYRWVPAVFLGSQWGLAVSPVYWWVQAGSLEYAEHEMHPLPSTAWDWGEL